MDIGRRIRTRRIATPEPVKAPGSEPAKPEPEKVPA